MNLATSPRIRSGEKEGFQFLESLPWLGILVGLCLGTWLPCDSVSVQKGDSLPQVAWWFLVAILTALLLAFQKDRRGASRVTSRFWLFLLIGLFAWVGVSTILVAGRGNLRFAVNSWWQWVSLGSSLWLLMRYTHRASYRNILVLIWIGLAVTVAWHGLYQYAISMPRDRAMYQKDPEAMLQMAGIDAPAGSSIRMQFENRMQSTEPLGPFALTNSLAGFLVGGLVLTLAFGWERSIWRRSAFVSWITILFILAICFGLTKSRTAWVALGVAIGFYVVAIPELRRRFVRYRMQWMVGAAVTIASLLLGIGLIDPLILQEAPKSIFFRWQYWIATVAMIADHPWFGVGLGNFQHFYPAYKLPEASETIADPHCFLLEVMAASGIPAGLFLCLNLVFFARWITGTAIGKGAEVTPVQPVQLPLESFSLGSNFFSVAVTVAIPNVIGSIIIWLVPGAIGSGPEMVPYLIGIPLSLLLLEFLMLRDKDGLTGEQDLLSSRSLVAATIGILTHLMASGGWLTPGNMLLMLTLIAMLVHRSMPNAGFAGGSEWSRWFPASIVGLGLIGFMVTAWYPMQGTQRWKLGALHETRPERLRVLAERAASQDRWDPEPLATLVRLQFIQCKERMQKMGEVESDLEILRTLVGAWIARDPADWSIRFRAANDALELAQNIPAESERAIGLYREAVKIHPTEAWLHLQLAIALLETSSWGEVKKEIALAMEIDAKNPHQDRKLAMASVFWPGLEKHREKGSSPSQSAPIFPNNSGFVPAEPALEFLRKILEEEIL